MRLRKKPWVGQALEKYNDFVLRPTDEIYQGQWQAIFGRKAPLHVELGTGKGRFICGMAEQNRHINFIGIEAQQDVLYYAAQKVAEKQLSNVRLLVFDINNVMNLFAPGEVNRFYINFCDPWPKARHDKRRLTHHRFLDMYRQLLVPGGDIHFKTDNEALFAFSLEEFSNYKWQLEQISYDLHASDFADNVMTEYEIKFSTKGGPIYRCEAKPPTII